MLGVWVGGQVSVNPTTLNQKFSLGTVFTLKYLHMYLTFYLINNTSKILTHFILNRLHPYYILQESYFNFRHVRL